MERDLRDGGEIQVREIDVLVYKKKLTQLITTEACHVSKTNDTRPCQLGLGLF